jgi:hypothetical protein
VNVLKRGCIRVFKKFNFFLLKIIFLYVLCVDLKNNFKKIKKILF